MSPHPLAVLFAEAADGRFPAVDGQVRVMPQPPGPAAAVVAFTGSFVVAADVEPDWVAERVDVRDFGAVHSPAFLAALAARLRRHPGALDMVMTAPPLAGPPPVPLMPLTDADHPRVRRARRYRDDVRVWTTPGGVLIGGRGLAGRYEIAFEVDSSARGAGLGRALATAGRHVAPPNEPVFVQVTPGNAASVRALLAAGFTAIGSEVLLTARRGD